MIGYVKGTQVPTKRAPKAKFWYNLSNIINKEGFPGGTVVKNSPANAGDTGSSPGPGRSHMP